MNLEQLKRNYLIAKDAYESGVIRARENLEKIKYGDKFGYVNSWGVFTPLILIGIVDEENCLIKVLDREGTMTEPQTIDTLDIMTEKEWSQLPHPL